MIAMGLILLMIWLGFLIPQYYAWKNKRYKTIIICLSSFVVSVIAFFAMVIYGGFIDLLLNGSSSAHTTEANEFVLCLLGFVWVAGHWLCWWYIYGRKSSDFLYVDGHTADEIAQIVSPEWKGFLGLK